MTKSTFRRSALLAAFLSPACIVRGGDTRPLYPGAPRPPAEVARVIGPIGEVDGQDVSHEGKSFSLLPGCHIVKLAAKTGEINTVGSGGYVANLPPAVYAFHMQAAHTYEIEVVIEATTGPIGPITIRAWDRDANGGGLEQSPVTSSAEIDDCLKWRP